MQSTKTQFAWLCFEDANLLAVVCVVLAVGGNCLNLIGLNFWLLTFPATDGPAQFAVQFISSLAYVIAFALSFAVFVYNYGWKAARFALFGSRRSPPGRLAKRIFLMFMIGLTDVTSNVMALLATPYTPEILQALMQTTIPVFTLFIAMSIFPHERKKSHLNVQLGTSFVLLVAGIAIGSTATFEDTAKITFTIMRMFWFVVYLLSCGGEGAWCVAQRLYLDHVTEVSSPTQEVAEELGLQKIPEWAPKLVMLLGGCTFQLLLTFALLPVNMLQGATLPQTWTEFVSALGCVFTCEHSLQYGLLYSLGYVMSYLGSAYLNEYSPTVSSLVQQLGGPVTALVVVAVPRWNVTASGKTTFWGVVWQLVSVALLFMSCATYNRWEHEQAEAYGASEGEDTELLPIRKTTSLRTPLL